MIEEHQIRLNKRNQSISESQHLCHVRLQPIDRWKQSINNQLKINNISNPRGRISIVIKIDLLFQYFVVVVTWKLQCRRRLTLKYFCYPNGV